ncbi:GntR family transcriptional regulator [Arthrobacter pityocampae]|uniref:GntR family transcriptional regulator n=1 Tax=Arthrobacter pityocampae TaxID=547334 RepID=A0A2S5IYS5_9MICC|nr:GntR family transcriptional regulator [Arthrobacter pityocampae]PPB49709.1 GntR family transcriptional regulator [Arthrobacter pityocampae]
MERFPARPSRPETDAAAPQRVLDAVRHDIIFGVLAPGSRVTEAALAAAYGVSRVPVREALRALEAEGFVESRPYAGSTVAAIPLDDAEDLFAVRGVIEARIARRAARRAAAQFGADAPDAAWWSARRALADILDDGDRAVAADALAELPELNIRFHLGVAELSGSASLAALLRQISGKIEWLYAADVDHRGKQSWGEHRLVLAAIDGGSETEAGRLMAGHVESSQRGYLERFAAPGAASAGPSQVTGTGAGERG